jgi:hypothetical protein
VTKPTVAVMDFAAANTSSGEAAVVSAFVRQAVIRSDKFIVVEKANMDKVLAEQAFQQTGCTSSECAVKMGKLLNARKMIVGEFSAIGGIRFLTASLVDVESGVIEQTARVRGFEPATADAAADQLVSQLTGVKVSVEAGHADAPRSVMWMVQLEGGRGTIFPNGGSAGDGFQLTEVGATVGVHWKWYGLELGVRNLSSPGNSGDPYVDNGGQRVDYFPSGAYSPSKGLATQLIFLGGTVFYPGRRLQPYLALGYCKISASTGLGIRAGVRIAIAGRFMLMVGGEQDNIAGGHGGLRGIHGLGGVSVLL